MTASERLPVAVRADWVAGPDQGKWTYEAYRALPDDGRRYEVVRGVLYMAPSPNRWHQKAVGRIFRYLSDFIEDKGLGEVYMAPYDVMLNKKTIVQPDVLVVLNKHLERITDDCVIGAPDLVIEVASPGTAVKDLSEKLFSYAEAGVPEYWVVNPDARTVQVLTLEGDTYTTLGLFTGSAELPSRVIAGLSLKVERIFPEQRESRARRRRARTHGGHKL